MSALAEGADRLVAHEVKQRSGRLIAVLPFEPAEYMKDFESLDSKSEFASLLENSDEVIELESTTDREAGYEAAGDYIIDTCDALIAIWDGLAIQGKGGTAGGVMRARERGMPIAWIKAGNRHPGTRQPTTLGAEQGTVVYENL
jgi:hypothetical protein